MDTLKDTKPAVGRSSCLISWSAIFSGALVAFSLGVLFNLLNAGLGLMSFPESFRALINLSVIGYIWLIICSIVTMFIAGFVAGRILRHYSGAVPCNGSLHGFLAWSLSLLASLIIASHFAAAVAANRAAFGANDNMRIEVNQSSDHITDQRRVEQAAVVLGDATIGIFFIFLFGAAAASYGGYVGVRDKSLTKFEP